MNIFDLSSHRIAVLDDDADDQLTVGPASRIFEDGELPSAG
ncbi:hypothetical protein [Arthrobacter sp. D1-29]